MDFNFGLGIMCNGERAKVIDMMDDGVLVEFESGRREGLGFDQLDSVDFCDSGEVILDALVRDSGVGVDDIVVTDDNFAEVSVELKDSILGALANIGVAIAEQKKLLQTASSPLALQNALKALAVTSANLIHSGTSMLSWMGKALNKDFSKRG